jgi:16S rRNA (guanine527-N7)-methyltransferase
MNRARMAELLHPFLPDPDPALLDRLGIYLDLLLRWNAHMNLTAVRDPEQMVTRHFGESLFAARALLGDLAEPENLVSRRASIADIGSGAGFPGIPMKLYAEPAQITLIESQNKKTTFLREVIRALELKDAEVYAGRADQWGRMADVVTLRAVERFDQVLPTAVSMVGERGSLGLLIGAGQVETARTFEALRWTDPVPIPKSSGRVLLVGAKA